MSWSGWGPQASLLSTCYPYHVEAIIRLWAWLASTPIPDSSSNGRSTEGIMRQEESLNCTLPNEMTSLWKAKLGVWKTGHLKETRTWNIIRRTFSRWPEGYKWDCVWTAISFRGSICLQVLQDYHTTVIGGFSGRNLCVSQMCSSTPLSCV